MKQSIFHRLSSVLWGAIVISIVLLAIYVSVGRMLSSLTGAYQKEILQELNHRVPFQIDADRVSAQWYSFSPVLVLDGLRITLPGQIERSIELSEGQIAFDVAGSLLTRSAQMTQVRFNGLDLAGELDADGQWRIRGFEPGDTQLGEWLEGFLPKVERVTLDGTHLSLALPDGERRDIELDLALSREGSRRRLEGRLSGSRGLEAFVLAEGVGNPFDPGSFTGRLYLDIEAVEVGAVTGLLGDLLGDVQVDGSLDLELWSSWDKGEPGAVLRLTMNNVLLQAVDPAWHMSLARVALDASLERRNEGWFLAVAGLELARDDVLLVLPRLQLDLRGETLDLRAQGLSLEPLGKLLAGSDTLPAAVLELVKTLQPRGSLPTLQVNVSDISAPFAGWQLLADFDAVAVEAWHGAPAVSGANGFAQLTAGSGFVVLDSEQFSMDFPTVYEQPLDYDDFHGTINIEWDEDSVALSSGLVEAHGEEGPVRVLFGLSIPLAASEVGLEMDLLVGLENTPVAQREKYIPYILSEQLRPWLVASIGDGLIEQGGFLWRGSLQADAAALYTVQLFFNVRDTMLNYHPDWPPLADVDGIVLIDDANVSVWADTARLFDSRVRDLSVEVWTDEAAQLWLAVDGDLAGPAADGLAVVNNSPLRHLVGDVLVDWQLTGELETDLELLLNLSDDSVAPEVEVSTRFTAVDLDIRPGKLPLRGISGILDYDTAAGFSSRDLVGQLWGRPLQVAVGQAPVAGPAATGHNSPVSVAFATDVDMNDIRQWLNLDALGFASGRTAVTMELLAGAGVSPILRFDSALAGVKLDLPAPWGKPADIESPLHLELALGGDILLLGLDMAQGLASELELADGSLRSAVLTLGGEALQRQAGRVRIGGHLAVADAAAWQRFVSDYVVADIGRDEPDAQGEPLVFSVDQLQVDELRVGGRNFGKVLLSAADDGGHWRIAAETDWLRGELLYVADGASLLDIDYLDLAGLDRLDLASSDAAEIIELPELLVTVDELRRADTLLGDLAFELSSDQADIKARNISGTIAAMQLRTEQPGELVWRQGPQSRTTMATRLYFQDLGQSLVQLGYQEIIATEEGSFNLVLEWPGGPQEFSLLAAQGSLGVDIGEGHFPDVSVAAAGTLRVVSILNLAEIVRRLSLSQMFESGIPFNKVDGEVFLHAGTIEVASMDVQGSASSFQFSGVSAVAPQTLDGELVVTLPVANNLPWVAALTAGLPVAAGVFLLSKVFENQFNRLTSLVYTATGTWDDPAVTFDRVFDDTAAPVASPAQSDVESPLAVPEPPAPDQSGSP